MQTLDISTFTADHPDDFKYDLTALLFDVFLTVIEKNVIELSKIESARDNLFSLNCQLFREVESERFKPGCAIIWHIPVDQTVATAKKMMSDYFNTDIEYFSHYLEATLAVATDKETIQKFVKEFSDNMAPKIVPAWEQLNIIGKTLPDDQKLNTVTPAF